MSILNLPEAKQYLRLEDDYTDEDTTIQSLIDSAEKYLLNAGCTLIPDDTVAKLAIEMLVSHWYENRETIGKGNKLAFGLQNLIAQLKYCYDSSTTTESGGTT